MKKTLGGDRIGSGSRMKVDLHNYGRSSHNMGYVWRSTMAPGTLVPFICEVGLPGDTFEIDLDIDVKTHPTLGPLFGSYKVQADIFTADMRLYQGQLHNNKLGIGMNMENVKLPLFVAYGKPIPQTIYDQGLIDNYQVNPSCLLKYLGISGIGIPAETGTPRSFNGLPLLSYWDIYKNYYANKQEEIGAVIHTPKEQTSEFIQSIWRGVPGTPEDTEIFQLPVILNVGFGELDYFTINFTPSTPAPDPATIIFSTDHGILSLAELAINIIDDNTLGIMTAQFDYATWGVVYVQYWAPSNIITPIVGKPNVVTFPLENIDEMREDILSKTKETTAYIMSESPNAGINPPYIYCYGTEEGQPYFDQTQQGLGVKTYQSDIFNNWLNTEWIDGDNGVNAISAIQVVDNIITMDQIQLSKKVYDLLNRIAVSGGSYDDWLDAAYTHERMTRIETPVYHGGLIKELAFQEVVATAEATSTTGTSQPLGTLAGKGVMTKKHKGGRVTIKVSEPTYIMGIISITPRVDYSQGNRWDTQVRTMNDWHKPGMDQIGFQDLITEKMAWWDTYYDEGQIAWVQRSAGKQPAWIDYMTNYNRTYGNFADPNNEMFMTLNRRYEIDPATKQIQDLTTYIDPAKFNFIFAETALDAQNFWVQAGVDITARRKMSAKIMPNL